MEFVADLHLHSKYSRAVSKDMNLYNMALWGTKKGLDLLSTADWTHPLWRREIQKELVEDTEGIFRLKSQIPNPKSQFSKETRFILSVEISSIYTQKGKVHRIHNLVFSPSIEVCEKIAAELVKRGCNLSSDGRPIVGLSSIQLMELIYSIDKNVLLVPCHAWTPWFALYGSNSGFDSIDDCFGEYADKIFGVETGLSSDPFMNWQIKELDHRSLISNSDAHSLPKMGREATVFVEKLKTENSKLKINYDDIVGAIKQDPNSRLRIGYTIEFYPEEGKYHYTGHRNCNFVQDPKQTKLDGNICPVCKRPLTVGVMHRVEELARGSRFPDEVSKLNPNGVKWIIDPARNHPPFVKLVPLNEIIAESLHSTVSSQKVKDLFDELCWKFGSELQVLLKISVQDLEKKAGPRVAEGVAKVRRGNIVILPGFDGQYGIVKIWDDKKTTEKQAETKSQLGIDF